MQDESQTGVNFKSKEAKYVLFNFHREKDLAAMTAVLRSTTDEPHIVALAGDIGCGRKYFMEAAIHRARAAGERFNQSAIDLDGYEHEKSSLEKYVLHQIGRKSGSVESYGLKVLEQSKLKLTVQGPSIWGMSFASVALGLDVPLKEALSHLARTFESIPGPERPPRECLSRLIRNLTQTHRLVLHVVDSAAITTPLREWLVDEARVNRNLILVFSCDTSDRNEAIAPRVAGVIRFELKPLNKQELRAAIDQRFSPNSFPDWLYAALWEYSRGVPGRLALKIADLQDGNFLVEDLKTGAWHLSKSDPLSYDLAQEFAPCAYESIRKVLSALPAATAERMETILQLSALCGDNIPIRLLLAHTMLAEGKRDEFLDLIDDMFTENPVFEDLGYSHPGFSGELIYTFSNPILRSVILEHVPGARRSQLALNLLSFLQQNLPVLTRGIARLFLEITRHLDSEREQKQYEQELAWWIGWDEVEEFSRYLQKAVKDGRLAPAAVLADVNRNQAHWPPYKSLAILNALVPNDREGPVLPNKLLGDFHYRRSTVRYECGLYEEAIDDATLGLRSSEGDALREAGFHEMMGVVKATIGKHKEALLHLDRARALRERELMPDHPAFESTLVNLACVYLKEARYPEAEPLLQRVLAIREKLSGPEHPATVGILNDLAVLYNKQGRYGEAEPLCRRALAIREMVLGPEHDATATSIDKLACLCREQGRLDEAEPLSQRALAIREKVLGPEHPDVADSLYNLALTYGNRGRYAEAETLCRRAIMILEKVVGPGHPDLAMILGGLAWLCGRQGKNAEAEPIYRRAVAVWEKIPGPDHPGLATDLNNLGLIYHDQGRYQEAEPLLQRALAIRERALGQEHAFVAQSLSNLGVLYNKQARYGDAESLCQRALAIRERVLGPEDPDVAHSLHNLALICGNQGKYAEAETLCRRAIMIREKVVGPGHPDLAMSLGGLAWLCGRQGKNEEAEQLYRRGLEIMEKAVGTDHPDLISVLKNYTDLMRTLGQHDAAEELESRAQAIHGKNR
jgi:tetratricopeptide (TPR) repeat protein